MAEGLEQPKSADTVLMPVLFRDGADRRASARVPLSSPVRMGPPKGEPYAVVSARDVSVGGLFIDADRDVRVGARFSAEIVLPSGEKVYVPEAEVAYNRARPHGSGFGVRFIDAPVQVLRAIEAEVRRAGDVVAPSPGVPSASVLERMETRTEPGLDTAQLTEVLPRPRTKSSAGFSMPVDLGEAASAIEGPAFEPRSFGEDTVALLPDFETPASSAPTAFDLSGRSTLDASTFESRIAPERCAPENDAPEVRIQSEAAVPAGSEPELGEPAAAASTPSEPAMDDDVRGATRELWSDLTSSGREVKAAMLERSRRLPLLWAALATSGVLLVASAIGFALWSGTRADVVEPVETIKDRGVSALTHQALVGDRTLPEVVEKHEATAPTSILEPKNPLPPLVYVDELEKKADVVGPVRELAATTDKATHAPAKPATPAKSGAVGKVEAVRPAPGKAEAKLEGKNKAEKPKALARTLDVPKAAEKPKALSLVKTEKPAPGVPANARLRVALAPKATVLKTHVLQSPDRFVIDLVGQDTAPAFPAPQGSVRAVRFGRHPDFARVVIETAAPIASGRASKSGRELTVTLDFSR